MYAQRKNNPFNYQVIIDKFFETTETKHRAQTVRKIEIIIKGILEGEKGKNIAEKINFQEQRYNNFLKDCICPVFAKMLGKKVTAKNLPTLLNKVPYIKQKTVNLATLETISIFLDDKYNYKAFKLAALNQSFNKSSMDLLPMDRLNMIEDIKIADDYIDLSIGKKNEKEFLEDALKILLQVTKNGYSHFPGVINKAIIASMRLSAYFDVWELCDFAIGELKDRKAKSILYEYKAEICYLLYQSSTPPHQPYLKQAVCYYKESIDCNPFDLTVNWNYFDMLLESSKISTEFDVYYLMMKKFWSKFKALVKSDKSDFDFPDVRESLRLELLRVIDENPDCDWIQTELCSWYTTEFYS